MEKSLMHQIVCQWNRYALDCRQKTSLLGDTSRGLNPIIPTCTPDQFGNQRIAGDQRVTQCQDGSFCCGKGSEASTCCTQRRGMFVVNGTTTSQKPSSIVTESRTRRPTPWSPPTSLTLPSVTTRSNGGPSNRVLTPTSSPSTALTSVPSDKPNHVIPIVASILGGVIGTLILLSTLIWLFRRRKRRITNSDSVGDSIVILDTARTTPTRQQSRKTKHYGPVHNTKRIDGTVRPPEFEGTVENEVWDRVIFVDQLGGAVIQMGF
ncbi:MAG: hypothetical protein Q9186_001333 [Xanthomendoza sp. 1 TL-2023]